MRPVGNRTVHHAVKLLRARCQIAGHGRIAGLAKARCRAGGAHLLALGSLVKLQAVFRELVGFTALATLACFCHLSIDGAEKS